jgi:hypothetical protein
MSLDDHPDETFCRPVETVTVDSVFNWLPRAG